ncbi:hypothetical protein ZHAS_00020650 [Anopheles sinensis]|uniref:Uncharacterized protein n=1 Tax=Anopheles sinensis TaxID=74873 RepID=A0A084WQA7_ANOSI|nr:hypothetical protein ZHAS_00020650 [Anopheles sinensis]
MSPRPHKLARQITRGASKTKIDELVECAAASFRSLDRSNSSSTKPGPGWGGKAPPNRFRTPLLSRTEWGKEKMERGARKQASQRIR